MNTATFSFADPWFLLLLALLPILGYLKGKPGGRAAMLFSSMRILRMLGNAGKSSAGRWLNSLFFLSLGLLVLGMARPRMGGALTRVEASGIDILLTLDLSRSMLAEDFTVGGKRSNRLVAVKEVCTQFIEKRPNDQIGIIAFAGRPYLVSPLTLDHDWLLQNLDRLRIGLVEDGTAIGSAIASASNRLKDRDSKSKVIVLLSDGENNAGRIAPTTAADAAKALGIKIYTIGTGARGLAPFPMTDVFGRTVYQDINVDFNDETLKDVAKKTGGEYFRATDTKSLEQIFAEINKLEKTEIKVTQYRQYDEWFPWFLMAGLGVLLVQTGLSETIWRRMP